MALQRVGQKFPQKYEGWVDAKVSGVHLAGESNCRLDRDCRRRIPLNLRLRLDERNELYELDFREDIDANVRSGLGTLE